MGCEHCLGNSFLAYLLSLDLTADVADLDLDGVQLLVGHLGDGEGLGLLGTLEGQLAQRDVPLTVILLALPARGQTHSGTDNLALEHTARY